ncbi:hypothetical protein GALMADRAFT_241187 [Galerina marginata CBS 339.88]|uniref:Uncharacterized protein n=1 Tax=Galerina marginata (strain CBS 339.88) TaxID=685588 RepID=A0A067TC60_GALM3|nr:hypothetical protein GALMADRAFT_241187 [Galerina marginata CBS 339.88]
MLWLTAASLLWLSWFSALVLFWVKLLSNNRGLCFVVCASSRCMLAKLFLCGRPA